VPAPVAPPPAPVAQFRVISRDEVVAKVSRRLKMNTEILSSVFEGPFSYGPDSLFLVVNSELNTFAVTFPGAPSARGTRTQIGMEGMLSRVDAVFFHDVTGDGMPEAFVLATYESAAGSVRASARENSVLGWNGSAIVSLPAIAARIASAVTEQQARSLLGI
jgi:hypothetical protein